MNPAVSIVIATRNRCNDALVAVESSVAQRYEPLEILLYDDASTDGTAEAIRDRFPDVKVFASSEQAGYLVWRNRAFRDAQGEFVVSIDDDSYFTDADTISSVVKAFDQFPQAAAIALPYYEPLHERSNGGMLRCQRGRRLRSFVGCAHALRRHIALEFGPYREFLTHQGEERDLCIRLIDNGWEVIYADAPPLVHLYSPHRDRNRVSYYGYRNTLLFSGLNVPHPYVVPRMVIDSLQLLKYRFQWQTIPQRIRAVMAGWATSWQFRSERQPVSRTSYQQFRSLPGHGPMETLEAALPEPLRLDSAISCWKS